MIIYSDEHIFEKIKNMTEEFEQILKDKEADK